MGGAGRVLRLLWPLCAALLCGQAMAQSPSSDEGWGLERLMSEFAGVQRASARFVERKYLKILDRPLELTGTLEYRAPDHLERRTLTPRALAPYIRLAFSGRAVPRASDQDVRQRGGDFVVGPDGRIRLAHASDDPADRPSVGAILAALER